MGSWSCGREVVDWKAFVVWRGSNCEVGGGLDGFQGSGVNFEVVDCGLGFQALSSALEDDEDCRILKEHGSDDYDTGVIFCQIPI
jgi:hypothetical protein